MSPRESNPSFDFSQIMTGKYEIQLKKNVPKDIATALFSIDLVDRNEVKTIEARGREGINKIFLAYTSFLNNTYSQGLCIYRESSQFSDYSIQNTIDRKNNQKFIRLAQIFQIRHFNVAAYYALVNEENKYSGFLMESVSQKGATIDDYLNSEETIPIERIHSWIIQLAKAIQFCHEKNVIHGEIKPANIFMTDDGSTVKLCNFNFDLNPDPTLTIRHSRHDFSAPETILGSKFSAASDVYSFGMMVFALLFKRYPFTGTKAFLHNPLNFRQFLEDGKRPIFPENISNTVRSLIENCWRTDPIQRPTMEQIVKQLQQRIEAPPFVEEIPKAEEEDEWDIIQRVDEIDLKSF